jgi:hypothetical protein
MSLFKKDIPQKVIVEHPVTIHEIKGICGLHCPQIDLNNPKYAYCKLFMTYLQFHQEESWYERCPDCMEKAT